MIEDIKILIGKLIGPGIIGFNNLNFKPEKKYNSIKMKDDIIKKNDVNLDYGKAFAKRSPASKEHADT